MHPNNFCNEILLEIIKFWMKKPPGKVQFGYLS
jgi:hypothetical protein